MTTCVVVLYGVFMGLDWVKQSSIDSFHTSNIGTSIC